MSERYRGEANQIPSTFYGRTLGCHFTNLVVFLVIHVIILLIQMFNLLIQAAIFFYL